METRRQGLPPSHAFSNRDAVRHWFDTQPSEAAVTLACRAGLRVLPLIVGMWGRPNFNMLQFFRSAQTAWAYARYPGLAPRALGRANLASLSENSFAGAAVMLAEATPLPRSRKNVADFACRAIFNAVDADEISADPLLEEMLAIDHAYDFPAKAKLAVELASKTLWREVPLRIDTSWKELSTKLWTAGDADWEVWIEWYEDRLYGRPSLGEAFDIAVATLPNELWDQGPAAVNARIKQLIAEYTPPDPIPAQCAGPHFELDSDVQIAIVATPEIDGTGNNVGRIGELLPLLRRAADRLVAALGSTNAFQALVDDARDYRQAIQGEPNAIAWGTVFGLGVMLETAATAAERLVPDRMRPSLEDDAKGALDAVRALHAAMILETNAGRQLMAQAERVTLSPAQQAMLRAYAKEIAEALAAEKALIKPEAAELSSKSAGVIGSDVRTEQGTAFGLATFGHLATILVPAAVVGEFALQAGGLIQAALPIAGSLILRESQRVKVAAGAIAGGYDHLVDVVIDQAGLVRTQAVEQLRLLAPFRDFVEKHQHPLLQIAENSPNLRWMRSYIRFITRANEKSVAAKTQVVTSIKIVVGEPYKGDPIPPKSN